MSKEPGKLNIAFVGRMGDQKNLKFALKVLCEAGSGITLHVFGPIDNHNYYKQCEDFIASNRLEQQVIFHGKVDRADLLCALSEMDLYFQPTMGENFGHSILEALEMGLPALISSNTPWTDLAEHQAGWVYDLDRTDPFVRVLKLARASGDEWSLCRQRAKTYFVALRTKLNEMTLKHWEDLLERAMMPVD